MWITRANAFIAFKAFKTFSDAETLTSRALPATFRDKKAVIQGQKGGHSGTKRRSFRDKKAALKDIVYSVPISC
jgi:hypothetical protein